MTWRAEDPQGNEAAKVRWDVIPFIRGVGADVGCGPVKVLPHATCLGVDSGADTALFGIPITPDFKVDSALDLPFKDEGLDYVFSSHLLEHIEDTVGALREWWRCIKVGGYLVLYLPHRDLYPNVGQPGANPDHKHDFVPVDITEALSEALFQGTSGFDRVISEVRDGGMEYSFLQVYRKRADTAVNYEPLRVRPDKAACVVRYGGFGDMIQAANILPGLKAQGFHVTVMTTPKGQDILKLDPHIDEFFVQDHDQVPNHQLVDFWRHQAKRFDRFVNLSESIEGTLLALPGRGNHQWPDDVRRRELNKNYLEWTADLAQLPYQSFGRFYASPEEAQGARDRLNRMRGVNKLPFGVSTPRLFSIVWVLAGSSVHKFYPGMDIVIDNLLRAFDDVHVTFVGDPACKILEVGWEENPRVTCASGELSIRDTLALAQVVDCVVGPETGVLNAVAFERNAKVVFLSHSSVNNLTKHWVNTRSMVPVDTPCYPCHRLHYTRDFCPEDKPTGAAKCQASIPPGLVYEAIAAAYYRKPPAGTLRLLKRTESA